MSNCHHYHLNYSTNQFIAQLRSCSDSSVQQTGLAQKDPPVVVLITMALIATRDFHRVSSKRTGESHLLKGDTFMHLLKDSVSEACL